ncbi:MAG: 2,3-bisphosphoglycerate-independent phosphoglycerate mutase [Candidatus Odinarchaeota archaeon]
MNEKKILFVVLDGGGDLPVSELDNLTPVEAASTPVLDNLSAKGLCGLMDVLKPGMVPGSDTAHLALLGYDPFDKYIYSGRGPVEAAGIGLVVHPGDIAFRANFATLKNGIIIDRRAGRINKRTDELAKLINGREIDGIKILFKEGTEHRGALILRGPGLSADVTSNDPKVEGWPPRPFEASSIEGKRTADVLNKLVNQLARKLPLLAANEERREQGKNEANYLLVRGAGEAMLLPAFGGKQGIKPVCIAGGGLYKGVATLTGMKVLDVPEATGGIDSDFHIKVKRSLKCLDDDSYNFVFLHIKATDNAGHDGKPLIKKNIFERIDSALEPILEYKDIVIALSPDHSTPCSLKDHSCDPVPCFITAPGRRTDSAKKFGERFAMQGSLTGIRGKHFMNLVFGLANRNKKFGS